MRLGEEIEVTGGIEGGSARISSSGARLRDHVLAALKARLPDAVLVSFRRFLFRAFRTTFGGPWLLLAVQRTGGSVTAGGRTGRRAVALRSNMQGVWTSISISSLGLGGPSLFPFPFAACSWLPGTVGLIGSRDEHAASPTRSDRRYRSQQKLDARRSKSYILELSRKRTWIFIRICENALPG